MFLALLMVLFTSCTSTRDYAQSGVPESQDITYQQFYDGLSPYGNWVDYPNYGYVWVPDEPGFRPYYNNGHWVFTNYGWTWVSNYNWGWAPFHYGRWLFDDAYGWMWVPGYEWAPAWVSWRSGNGCYGWAPLAPGLNFDVNMGSRIPYNHWAFVPSRYINSPRINNYYIAPEKNVTIINNTRVINNTHVTNNKTVYVTGPSATEVEKVTNERIRPVKIVQTNRPGNTQVSGSTVSIYKPGVREIPQQNAQVRPARVIKLNELKANRVNTGAAQNEVPQREIQEKPGAPVTQKPSVPVNERPAVPANERPVTPANTKTEPANNTQKNNQPAVNEKTSTSPVVEKQVPLQQPQRVVPVQKTPDVKQENVNTPNTNGQQTPNTQQNNTNNRPPAVNNDNQPAKVRMMNQSRRNSENTRQNVSPAPVNTPPAKMRQVMPQRSPASPPPVRQLNRPPVNTTPINRNPNFQEPRESRGEIPAKERK